MENEITSRIAVALNAELIGVEAARPTEHPDALHYLMLGREALWKSPTAESYAEAVGFFPAIIGLGGVRQTVVAWSTAPGGSESPGTGVFLQAMQCSVWSPTC